MVNQSPPAHSQIHIGLARGKGRAVLEDSLVQADCSDHVDVDVGRGPAALGVESAVQKVHAAVGTGRLCDVLRGARRTTGGGDEAEEASSAEIAF